MLNANEDVLSQWWPATSEKRPANIITHGKVKKAIYVKGADAGFGLETHIFRYPNALMETQPEQKLFDIDIKRKVFSATHIRLGTFLGGPLMAGYYIAQNYIAFGEEGKAKAAFIYGIAATIIIFGGVILLPGKIMIPNYVIPIVYCWIAFYLVEHFQGAQIAVHTKAGEGLFGWGRVIVIALIGLAITLICLAIVIIATGDYSV